MKRYLRFTLVLAFLCCAVGLMAQIVPQGINYQAVARDGDGQPMANQRVSIRLSLSSSDLRNNPFFAEKHEVVTDDNGYFSLIIGRGLETEGALAKVPWADQNVWLNLEMKEPRSGNFRVVSSNELLSVPYAFFAEEADRLADNPDNALRSGNSIYWTTTGNTFTRAPYHYLGTRDDKDLHFKTANESRVVITAEGQTQIRGGVGQSGSSDSNYDDYPLTVQGSEQGIYIKVNTGRSSNNNFVTFADGNANAEGGNILGRIEGQTLDELKDSEAYKRETALFALSIASLTAQLVGLGAEAAGLAASGFGAGAVVGVVAQAVGFTAALASLIVERDGYISCVVESVGVAYLSGGADYAEYLPRVAGERDLMPAEIVGVRAGEVSLKTDTADHLMVISSAPIVLGNTPQPGMEEGMEKVAFMGQVPVRIAGPVALGDYILPSGNNDGVGIAIHPDDMQAGDYHRIIGVAWEEAEDRPSNIVNIAVGINANDLSQKVEQLNARVDNILAYLKGEEPLMGEEEVQMQLAEQVGKPKTIAVKRMSDQEFDRILEENQAMFQFIFAEAQKQLATQDPAFLNHPEVQALFANPAAYLRELRRDPQFSTQWSVFDNKFQK